MKFVIIFIAVIFISASSDSQILPKKALERKATKIIEKKINEAPEEPKKEDPPKDENEVQQEGQEGRTTREESGTPTAEATSLETYSRFDFIAGEKIIFYDDFSQDNVGDFPTLWNTNGSAEVVTTSLFPGKWMKFSSRDAIWTDALLHLPDNYTIEFDIVPTKGEEGGMAGYHFRLIQAINPKTVDHGAVPGNAGFLFSCEYFGRTGYRTYINSEEGENLGLSGYKEGKQYYQSENKKYHISIWVQKARIRLYQDQNKLFDLPRAFPVASVKMDRIRFDDGAAMVSNIRIAIGSPDMRSKLLTEGKLVSYGIYFDVNKDVVKPESYGTLKEIASVLSENPDVTIRIVGHTDADGSNDANLDLSKRRAASVKNELVKSFGIGAERIETDGSGESQPVAANDTPANKALNRRVEFIKLK